MIFNVRHKILLSSTLKQQASLSGLVIGIYLIFAITWGRLSVLSYGGHIRDFLFIVVTVIYVLRKSGIRSAGTLLFQDKPPPGSLKLGLIAIGVYCALWLAGRVILELLDEYSTAPNLSLQTVFSTWLAAPVLEEILFRGIFITALLFHFPRKPLVAIAIAAATFAVIHQWSPAWKPVPLFLSGCFYGWLFLRTRSILYPIVAHSFSNIIASFPVT